MGGEGRGWKGRERGVFGMFYSCVRFEEVVLRLWEYGKGGGGLEVGRFGEGGQGGRGWWLRDEGSRPKGSGR